MALTSFTAKNAAGTDETLYKLPSAPGARASMVGVGLSDEDRTLLGRSGYTSTASFTRPANTTTYTAGDAVGATAAALTFASIGPSAGGEVLLTSVKGRLDTSAIISGMTSFSLALYNVTPPSAYADNAVWDLPSGDRTAFVCKLEIGFPLDLGSTLEWEVDNIWKQVTVPSGGTLYGYCITNGAWQPTSALAGEITLKSVPAA